MHGQWNDGLHRMKGLREAARACIEMRDLDHKVRLSRSVLRDWRKGGLEIEASLPASNDVVPGLPHDLQLTSPTKVRRRGFGTREGLAAFVHAIAHIEWNAINLAWDAVWRFDAMPREYYDDWASVAADEARH